jgi:hypothetical protein
VNVRHKQRRFGQITAILDAGLSEKEIGRELNENFVAQRMAVLVFNCGSRFFIEFDMLFEYD